MKGLLVCESRLKILQCGEVTVSNNSVKFPDVSQYLKRSKQIKLFFYVHGNFCAIRATEELVPLQYKQVQWYLLPFLIFRT